MTKFFSLLFVCIPRDAHNFVAVSAPGIEKTGDVTRWSCRVRCTDCGTESVHRGWY